MTEVKIKLSKEVLQEVREIAGRRGEAEVIAELVEEGLRSRVYSRTMESLRKGEISLLRAAEKIGIPSWEIFRKASKEEVLVRDGDIQGEAGKLRLGRVIVDASVLVPLYDAGSVAGFTRGLAKLGAGSPIMPYSMFTVVYGFAKARNPSEDVSKPLRLYRVLEISREEKEKAASMKLQGLAYVDKEAVYIAKREEAYLLTNDAAVVSACRRAGVEALRFASVLLKIAREKAVPPEAVAEMVYGVQWTGPRLGEDVVRLLMQELQKD